MPISLAELVDLAPIAALVRAFGADTIEYWSRGAGELYGWTAEEALGQVSHALLQTQFPISREAVDNALRSVGHWSGELVHTCRDGRRIVVASRQAVQKDDGGQPTYTLELNTDITSINLLQASLMETEERFHLLVDNVQDYAIFMLSPEGEVLTWNEGAQRLKGYAPDEIIGQNFARFYPPEAVAAGMPTRMLAQAATEGRVKIEDWRVRKDGSRFWADVVITALREHTGTLRGFAKITRDLTERRQAEEARARASREEGARAAAQAAEAEIRASRDQLAAILTGVADGITAIDTRGHIVFANAEAARLSGFDTVEEFVASNPAAVVNRFDVFDERGAPFPLERLPTRLALLGQPAPETLLCFRTRGTTEQRWSLLSAAPIRDPDGQVRMAVSIFRDVTEARRAEDMTRFLAALNLELSRSLDSASIAQTLVDLAVPVLSDWCAVDLFEDADLKRAALASTSEVTEARAASVLPDAQRLLANRAPILLQTITDADLRQFARDADHFQELSRVQLCSMIVVPLVAHDRVLGGITFATAESQRHYAQAELRTAEDLATRAALALDNARLYRESQQQTETHVQLNIALRDAMEQLEQALATRDEFLASASHDLKNPIASIKAMAQLLERRLNRTGQVSEQQLHETLTRIDAVATRASAQVEELLDLTRMRLDRPLDLDRDPVDLVQLVGEVVGEQQQGTESRTISFEAAVSEIVGHWDARRLTRALSNILDNALKYSPDGSPIQVRLVADTDWVILSVEDHGIGIPPEDVQSIFTRFQRGRNVVGRVSGTGIGLASAHHIVQSHGGTLEASSELGVGTTITLRLPVVSS